MGQHTGNQQRTRERRRKKKKKKEEKKKKKREVRKDDNNILYFLSFSFLFLSLFSSFLDLPFLSLCRRDRKGKERESGEREERKRERKGKEREFIAVIFPCSPFFTFYFPFSPFFFPLFALFSLADATGMMSYVVFQTQRSRLSEMVVLSLCFSLRALSGLFLLMYACLVYPFMQLKANSIGFLTRKRVQSCANHLLFFRCVEQFFFTNVM